jgi:hypothetical protein
MLGWGRSRVLRRVRCAGELSRRRRPVVVPGKSRWGSQAYMVRRSLSWLRLKTVETTAKEQSV